MNILTGDDNGLLKWTQFAIAEKPKQLFKYGLQKENHEIDCIQFSMADSVQYVTFTHSNGIVKCYDTESQNILYKKKLDIDDKAKIKSIGLIGEDVMDQKLVFVQSNGAVSSISLNYETVEEEKQENLFKIKMRSTKEKLTKMLHRAGSEYLFLGQFCPQVYDIETKKCTWKSKNVPNDQDDLEVPLFDTDGSFLPNSDRKFVTSHAHGKLRLYDLKAQLRPVIDFQATDYLLSCIKPTPWGNYVLYSSQKGELTKADIRVNFRTVHRLKGAKGTIRDLAVEKDFVAWVGLDRYLRVYHHETRETVGSVYMKQKLNSVLIDPESADDYSISLKEHKAEMQKQEDEEYQKFMNGDFKRRKRRRQGDEMIEKDKTFKFEE